MKKAISAIAAVCIVGTFALFAMGSGTDDLLSSFRTDSQTESTTQATQLNENIGADFKEAMDSYEEFTDEYVAFMEKYKKSGGTDLTLVTDYTNYVKKYADEVQKFQKWVDEGLTAEETAYYLEVQTRVTQKMAAVITE